MTTDRSKQARRAVPTQPCEYTVETGGTHPKGCRYVSHADRARILKGRTRRKMAKASRRANR
jgi:hypothetical protein